MAWTKEKQSAYAKVWRERNREKVREYMRAYAEQHRDTLYRNHQKQKDRWNAQVRARAVTPEARAQRKARDAAKRELLRAQRRAWAERNPERELATAKRSRDRRRAVIREANKKYRTANPVQWKAAVEKAKAKKPELYRQTQVASSMTRRARMRQILVEPVSLGRIVQRDGGFCHLCGKPVVRRAQSFDHLIPICRLGAHAEWNLMLAHNTCNKRRGSKQILTDETKVCALAYIAERVSVQEPV